MSENRKLLRSTLVVAAPTVLSRILGYIRDLLQAFYLGTTASGDAFSIAYTIPNLLRRLTAEGAMTSAFIPVFSQLKKEKTKQEVWKFANLFFFDLMVIMVVFVVLGMLFAPVIVKLISPGFKGEPGKWELTTSLTYIMLPYMALVSLAALAMAVLNSFKKFFIPALTPVALNLSIITGAFVYARKVEEPAFVFAAAVVIGGILQLAIQLPLLWRLGMRFRFGLSFVHPAVRKIGVLMVPGIFGAGIVQINFMISRTIASFLESGSVASLYYASRVQELTLGVFSIALATALLPTLSEATARNDTSGMKKTIAFSLKSVFFISFPAMAGLVVLHRPIIQVLFEWGVFDKASTAKTAPCLLFFALGIPFISGVKVLTPPFYALKDTRTPAIIAFFVMFGYIGFAVVLMGPLRVSGIALALSISSVFHLFFLYLLLRKKIGSFPVKDFLVPAARSAFFSGIMGGGVWLIVKQFNFEGMAFFSRVLLLSGAITGGIAVYLLLNLVISPDDIRSFKGMFSRKKTPPSEERP